MSLNITALIVDDEPLARRLVQEELLGESDDGAQRLWLRSSGRRWLRSPWPLHWPA